MRALALCFVAPLLSVSAQAHHCPPGVTELPVSLRQVLSEQVSFASPARRQGTLSVVVRIDPMAERDLRLVPTEPNPRRKPRWLTQRWLTYSIRSCSYISTFPPPQDVQLGAPVEARRVGRACRGSAGIALLDRFSVRRVRNSQLRC
jgi:hypothetical protein